MVHVRSSATAAVGLALGGAVVHAATGLLKNAAWPDGSNCVDQPWYTNYALLSNCHGEKNQQWELMSDGLLRSLENNCFELPETGDDLLIVPCDATRRQKWFVSDGQIKPQGFRLQTGDWSMRVGWCVDATQPDGKLVAHVCHGGRNQKFSSASFPTENEDIIRAKGPWADGQNCLDFDFTADFVYVYACHGQSNQRWSFTAKEELRVMGNKCLEYDDKNGVYVRACTGLAKQKWVVQSDGHIQPKGYQAADGSFVSMDTKCLDASLESRKLYLYNCIADQANQMFMADVLKPKGQDLIKVDGTWADGLNCVDYNYDKGYANIYSCHGKPNQMWELTADNQVRSMMDNMCLTFEENEVGVYMSVCSAASALQKWRVANDGQLHPLGFRKGSGEWRTGATRCLTAALDTGILFLYDCSNLVNQRFRSRVMASVRDYIYAVSPVAGSNCVAFDGTRVVVATCSPVRTQTWEFTLTNELRVDGKCLVPSGSDVKVAACDGSNAQKWKALSNGGISPRQATDKCLDWGVTKPTVTLAACSATKSTQLFRSNVFQSGINSALSDKTSALLDAVVATPALNEAVLTAAAAVVDEAEKALSSSTATDAASAKSFLLQFLFGTATLQDYSVPIKALYDTAKSKEFLLLASVLVGAAKTPGKTLDTIKPFVAVFSDQLYDARREVLWDRVLSENVLMLEASVDGMLDDFDVLGGALVAICRSVPLDLSVCALAQYFQLMDKFVTFKYRLAVEGASAMRNTTLAMGANLVKLYAESPLASTDPLWKSIMNLLVFQAPYVGVIDDAVLARASAPTLYLPAFVLFSFFDPKNANLASLDSQVRFLSDQVTTYHFNNLLKMTENREMDALDDYMTTWISQLPLLKPINNYTTSDFPILVQFVTPLVCDSLVRAPLSLCQLETFNDGLQSVLRFERQRRDNIVALDDVLEVDVRKKLDVIDQEKKQYEIITTLQSVANKIGATFKTEVRSVKKQITDSTTLIRQDIEKTRQQLRGALKAVGTTLQDQIDESTKTLYDSVVLQAAAIRQDIAENSRQLEDRINETGQKIFDKLQESKEELKYQIGAEAEKTRTLVTDTTNSLKEHMSNEAAGLRTFIDQKTGEIIGVVHTEGENTRVVIDQKTKMISDVVRQTGEDVRQTVRDESKKIQDHIDVKSNEIIGEVKSQSAQTRDLVVKRSTELKTHITSEANGIKDTVTKAKNDITNTMTKQYNALYQMGEQTQQKVAKGAEEIKNQMVDSALLLGDIHSSSCVTAGTTDSDLNLAREKFDASLKELQALQKTAMPRLKKLGTTTSNLLEILFIEKMFWAAVAVVEVASNFVARPKTLLNAAKAAGKLGKGSKKNNADLAEVAGTLIEGYDTLKQTASEAIYVKEAQGDMKKAAMMFKEATDRMLQIATDLAGKEAAEPTKWVSFGAIVSGDVSDDTVDLFIEDYKNFDSEFRTNDVNEVMEKVVEGIEITCASLNTVKESKSPFTSGEGSKAITECMNLTTETSKLGAWFSDAFGYLDQMRSSITRRATSGMECNKTKELQQWGASMKSRRLRRDLQGGRVDLAINEPYYTMSYTALAKVLLDYQLQEAAFQFCKFYEFKNGGVAPPMCGATSARSYYTLTQVLQMRSWNPPTYTTALVRAYLPTKPVMSSVYNRTYPYVDLTLLRAGSPTYFTLPTWDIDWLKKYGWLSPTVDAAKVPSVYIESILIYLPMQANSVAGDPASSSLTAAIHVQTGKKQYLSLTNKDRTFQLPSQTFTTGATYGAANCLDENALTNPYDVVAQCVQDDATSDVCLRERGTTEVQNQKRLLPSLFSTWRLTADFSQAAGGALDMVVPKPMLNTSLTNSTGLEDSAGMLMLIADVTIVEISSAKGTLASTESTKVETRVAPSAEATCCAPDSFRFGKNKCDKCPIGMTGAGHGYACVPI